MKPYLNIADLIESLESEIQLLTEQISILKKEPTNFNEQIIMKYIDTGSTGKTKDFVRSFGVMSERGSFYSSGDVSKLIKNGADDISPVLLDIARKIATEKNKNGKKR